MGEVNKTNSYTEFFYKAFRNILLVSIPLAFISALILGLIPHSSAEVSSSSSDDVSFTLSTSCTISGEVISAHHAELHGGQLVEDVGNTKLNAYCNDNNGYSIYAIGSSNNIDGNTNLVSSVSSDYNVHTGVYDSSTISSTTPSSWAMKLTAGVGVGSNPTVPTIENGYNNYKEIPSTYTQVAKRTSKTDMNLDTTLSGSYINTTYQIYASSIQPAGTYSGRVKYVMVHPSSNNNYLSFNEAFAINGKYPITTETGTYYAMQDMSAAICNSIFEGGETTAIQLVDIRDDKLYWVAKLKDGHCWMTQNLDFDIDAAKPLTSNDTDFIDHSLSRAYTDGYSYDSNTGVITWVPAASAETINFTGIGVSGWTNSAVIPSSASKADDLGTGHASLGNYYNWTAAIASNDSSSLAQTTFSDATKNPKNSICPKGWRLPTISNQSGGIAGSTSEFSRLNYLYNDTGTVDGLTIAPLWLLNKGGIFEGTISYFDQGLYWSSSLGSNTDAYQARIGEMDFSARRSRTRGIMVRCVAR